MFWYLENNNTVSIIAIANKRFYIEQAASIIDCYLEVPLVVVDVS